MSGCWRALFFFLGPRPQAGQGDGRHYFSGSRQYRSTLIRHSWENSLTQPLLEGMEGITEVPWGPAAHQIIHAVLISVTYGTLSQDLGWSIGQSTISPPQRLLLWKLARKLGWEKEEWKNRGARVTMRRAKRTEASLLTFFISQPPPCTLNFPSPQALRAFFYLSQFPFPSLNERSLCGGESSIN